MPHAVTVSTTRSPLGAATSRAPWCPGSPEVLLGEDVRGVEAPRCGHLHVQLLEGHRAVAVVGDAGVAPFPHDLVVGMGAGRGEVAADADAGSLRCDGHGVDLFLLVVGGAGRCWCGVCRRRWCCPAAVLRPLPRGEVAEPKSGPAVVRSFCPVARFATAGPAAGSVLPDRPGRVPSYPGPDDRHKPTERRSASPTTTQGCRTYSPMMGILRLAPHSSHASWLN